VKTGEGGREGRGEVGKRNPKIGGQAGSGSARFRAARGSQLPGGCACERGCRVGRSPTDGPMGDRGPPAV
jgi:hypothetical protein